MCTYIYVCMYAYVCSILYYCGFILCLFDAHKLCFLHTLKMYVH